jgi:bile acid:Na+ symporter, BASS family
VSSLVAIVSQIIVKNALWWVLASIVFGILFANMVLHYLLPLIPIFLAGMMASAGLMITLKDLFRSGIKPSRISIIVSSQFVLSTSVGFVVAFLFFNILSDSPNLALGQVLHGAMPSEQTTPVWIRLAGGNTPLGITTLIFSTIVSPFASPVLVLSFVGTWVELDYIAILVSMVLTVLIPTLIGSLVRSARPNIVERYEDVFSSTSVLFALPTVVIVGALAVSFLFIQPFQILLLAIVASLIHFSLTLAAGWSIPRILHWEASDAPVSIYNVSMKEFTVTLGIIAATGLNPEVGVPAALYGIMHMAAAPLIAKRLRSKHTSN